jgi:hypothetical protein
METTDPSLFLIFSGSGRRIEDEAATILVTTAINITVGAVNTPFAIAATI